MADRPPRRADAFFAAVIEHPWLVLAAFALVTLLAASQLPRTRVVTDLRSLIPRDDVYLDDAKVRRAFGLKDYVVIGVVREEGVFHEETLRHVRRLAEEVAGVEGVLKVRSLFSEDNIRDTSAGLRIEPFLDEINAASVEAARQAVVLALAALGIRQVYIQDSFISNFKRSSPVRRSNAELNRRLSGSRMFHVELDTGRPDGVKDPAFLRAVDRAQQDAQGLAGAGGSISLVRIVKKMNQELLGDYALPDGAAAVAQMLFLVDGKSCESLWDPTYRKARVTSLRPRLALSCSRR